VYNYIGLGLNFEIRRNGIRWNETKHVELEQFLHAFTSRGFDSVSWAFFSIGASLEDEWKIVRTRRADVVRISQTGVKAYFDREQISHRQRATKLLGRFFYRKEY